MRGIDETSTGRLGNRTDVDPEDIVRQVQRLKNEPDFARAVQDKSVQDSAVAVVSDWTDYRAQDRAHLELWRSQLEAHTRAGLAGLGYDAAFRSALYDSLYTKATGRPSKFGPLDRWPEDEWRRRFKRHGFIHAEIVQDELTGRLRRMVDLSPSAPALEIPLYRGSSRKLASRWSWTDKIVGAVNFALEFHDGLPAVWLCEEIEAYLARLNFNDRGGV